MPKQSWKISSSERDQAAIWRIASGRVFSLVNVLILVALAWVFMAQVLPSRSLAYLWLGGVIILATAIAIALERSLLFSSLSHKWRYRLAFLGSWGIFLVLWLWNWVESFEMLDPGLLIAALVGAFAGGILATYFSERLWENNSPPSAEIIQDVYQQHRNLIGDPGNPPGTKRAFDLLLAAGGLLLSLPIWLVSIFMIWFEDPGPLLFVKNSVGKGGLNFHQYKLRTMVRGAEDATGPILASEKDERVLRSGYLLRKTALDELPQLINILRGEMSFVGPRPQRTVLVQGYLQQMPEYAHRHRVLPGLAGLAQVAGDYYLTPRQKLRFDRLYIDYSSLGFDLKLIALAFLITFWFRWQKDWDGRLPRWLFRFGSSGNDNLIP
jgi:lipopolysaccharide/colanic/teichoic acid biosynthesis glycosyltransferase